MTSPLRGAEGDWEEDGVSMEATVKLLVLSEHEIRTAAQLLWQYEEMSRGGEDDMTPEQIETRVETLRVVFKALWVALHSVGDPENANAVLLLAKPACRCHGHEAGQEMTNEERAYDLVRERLRYGTRTAATELQERFGLTFDKARAVIEFFDEMRAPAVIAASERG